MDKYALSKGTALAVFMVVSGTTADAADLPQRPLPRITTTACIMSGEANLAAALEGSDPADTQHLITLEMERRKSKLGALISDSNKAEGVLRCTFRGPALYAEYDWPRKIVFVPAATDKDVLNAAGIRAADIEESFHAFQITTRPDVPEAFTKYDALGLYSVLKGLELEAKVATSLVVFEMTGDLDAVTSHKSMIFRKGKPMEMDLQAQTHVRKALEAAQNPSTDDAVFMGTVFASAFNLLLYADDTWYTGRVGRWAESAVRGNEKFDIATIAVLFSALPNGIQGHLKGITLDIALANADDDNREFIAKHRPDLLKR
ncbi:MAG: hypothetical protein EBQ96_01005 [Proteobacteria bacterium]|nr:hypothetical protein [Pseudomonadota bacterium]